MDNLINERSLLSCILQNFMTDGFCEFIELLNENDFTLDETKKVFKAIKKLHKDNNIDVITISQEVDDYQFVDDIYSMPILPSNWKLYFDKLKLVSKKNKLKEISMKLQQISDSAESLIDIEELAKKQLDLLQDDEQKKDDDEKVIDYLLNNFLNDVKKNKEESIISTGFLQLNNKLGGGIFPGLYCIGGISSLGKTAIVLQISDYIAKQGNDVIFYSLEMSKLELVSRSISRILYNIDRQKYKEFGTLAVSRGKFSNDAYTDLTKAMQLYEQTANYLQIVEGNFNTGIMEIRRNIESHVRKHNKKPTVIIDYLQILRGRGNGSDKQEIDYVATELKRISRDYDIPVIVISSLNRASYATPVSFESFKESGSIEYTADTLIGLQLTIVSELDQSEKKKHENKVSVNSAKMAIPRLVSAVILKQRNGASYAKQDFYFYPINNFFQEVGAK